MKRKSLVVAFAAVMVSVGLAACGGGGGDSPASGGSGSAGASGGVPAEATVDGQAFVVWLKTLFADADSQGDPIKVEASDSLVDETAEPGQL